MLVNACSFTTSVTEAEGSRVIILLEPGLLECMIINNLKVSVIFSVDTIFYVLLTLALLSIT